MLFSVVALLDRDVAVAPVFPELVIGGDEVQRESFAHEVELRRVTDARTGLELRRTFGRSGLIRPSVGIFDVYFHIRAEISIVRGVAQQKQVLFAYRTDGAVGGHHTAFVVVVYGVRAGIGAVVNVKPGLVGTLAEVYGNRAGEVARQGNTLDGNCFLLFIPVIVVVHGETQPRHDMAEIETHVPRGAQVVIGNGDHRVGRLRVVQFVLYLAVCRERHGERQFRYAPFAGIGRTFHFEIVLRVIGEEGVPVVVGSGRLWSLRRVVPFPQTALCCRIGTSRTVVGDGLVEEHVGEGVAALVAPVRAARRPVHLGVAATLVGHAVAQYAERAVGGEYVVERAPGELFHGNGRGGKADGIGAVGFGLHPFLLLAGGAEEQEGRKYVSLLHLDIHFIVRLQIAYTGLFGHVDGDVPACGVAPRVDCGRVEHDVASAGEGERVTVMIRRFPRAHGGGRQRVRSGLSRLGIGVVADGQLHPVRERLRNEQQVARHVRSSGRSYESFFLHADSSLCHVTPRNIRAAVVVALDSQSFKGDGTYRGVASLAACRESDACQQMSEFEGYRTGRFCLACHDGDTCLFRRHQVVPFRGVEASNGKSAVRRAGDGHATTQCLRGRIEGVEVVGIARMPVLQATFVRPAGAEAIGYGRVVEYLHVAARAVGVMIAAPHAERLTVGVQVVRTPDGGACQRGLRKPYRSAAPGCLHTLFRAFRAGGSRQQYRRLHEQDSEGVLSSVHISHRIMVLLFMQGNRVSVVCLHYCDREGNIQPRPACLLRADWRTSRVAFPVSPS